MASLKYKKQYIKKRKRVNRNKTKIKLNEIHRKLYYFLGQKRAGNHAIIYWLIKESKENFLFMDNKQFGQNRHLPTDVVTKNVIVSFENPDLSSIKSYTANEEEFMFHKIYEKKIILLIRDPFNLMASHLRWKYSSKFAGIITTWIQFAKEYLGYSKYIRKKVCINYNKWFIDSKYRVTIRHMLGYKFTDKSYKIVSKQGGGSSFDGRKYNRHADKMDVLQRWKEYWKDKKFRDLFTPEVIALANKIFDASCGKNKLPL